MRWFWQKKVEDSNRETKYPTDEMIASAPVVYAPDKFSNLSAYQNISKLSEPERKELFAMFYMINKAINQNEKYVCPGIDPPYESVIIDMLEQFGYEVKPSGANTYQISW